MGGSHPGTAENAATAGKIRFHENKPSGEVHFHDDGQNLKCAVPVAEWDKKWNTLKKTKRKITFKDVKNGAIATIKPKNQQAGGGFDVKISLKKLGHSPTFEALEKLGS